MSLEAVFGALGGALILHENMGLRGYLGAALMMAGILLSQVGPPARPTKTTRPKPSGPLSPPEPAAPGENPAPLPPGDQLGDA
jgi:hypothetical protein